MRGLARWLPSDRPARTLQFLRSRHCVNVVIADKLPAPQWLTMDAAVTHCTEGIGIWQWASNDQNVAPDVVMAQRSGPFPALERRGGVEASILDAQQALEHRTRCNRAARRGEYTAVMESTSS
jgi:phosphoketolase